MAVAAFKSSSRRATTSSSSTKSTSGREVRDSSPPPKKAPIRRSRSVSVSSRNSVDASVSSTAFSNSRDNPLFATSTSPRDDGVDDISSRFSASQSKSVSSVAESRRGRSVARNGDSRFPVSGSRKEVGRSLSKVDTGRRDRSLSQGPIARYHHSSCESEAEHELSFSRISKNRGNPDSVSDQTKGRTWSSQHSVLDPSDNCGAPTSCSPTLNWDDKASTTSSLSGPEQRTISAVCEKMKPVHKSCLDADSTSSVIYETIQSEVRRVICNLQHDYESDIRRSNANPIANADMVDIPLGMVNPSSAESVVDIEREYATRLEKSRERARQLRADLAVEEYHGQELSKILREMIPDPKTSSVQKFRHGRKGSLERRRMSKRLTEEAMTYFDECVSLSTFDSSDFSSSQEDPPHSLPSVVNLVGVGSSFPQEPDDQTECPNQQKISGPTTQGSHAITTRDRSSPSSANSIGTTRKSHFSFASKPDETFKIENNIEKYITDIDQKKPGLDPQVRRRSTNHHHPYYDSEDYKLQDSGKSLLFDKLLMRNRIESGGLLLCDNVCVRISVSPFSNSFT